MSRARDDRVLNRGDVRLTVEPVGTAEERRRRLEQFVQVLLTAAEGGERRSGSRHTPTPAAGGHDRSRGGKDR